MASEDVRIENGHVKVDRVGVNKSNVDIALSEVESFDFHRGGEADGQSDGALVLHTKNGGIVIRVADHDAGKVLKLLNSPKEEKKAPTNK